MNRELENQQKELLLLTCGVLVSLLIHALFILKGFGEPDSCRLAILASDWHATGYIQAWHDSVRTGPLYVHLLKLLLDAGLPLHVIPALMNWTSVILGSCLLFPMFFLWKLLSSSKVATVACIIQSFVPAFWLGNIYGMSHLPALFYLLNSVLYFLVAINANKGVKYWVFMLAACICGIIAVCLKADIILYYGIFLGIVIFKRNYTMKNIIFCVVLPCLAITIVIYYSKIIAPKLIATSNFASNWTEHFPLTLKAITNLQNAVVPVVSVGIWMFLFFLGWIIYASFYREHRQFLYLALWWALPPCLFWCLRLGNLSFYLHIKAFVA